MKKNLIRTSMLAVASFSLLIGGFSAPASVKDQVSTTPYIISKAIENDIAADSELNKGTPVEKLAMTTENDTETVSEQEASDNNEPEVKEVKVESNQVVANIDSYLNIRTEANEDSEVVGKFYNGNVGTVVEKGDDWSLVASGNAYGYVKNEFLLFGSDAENYIENNCDQIVKVNAETVNVRAAESTDSEVLSQKDEGEALTILGKNDGWYEVAVTDDQTGYVSSDYVYVDYVYETAVTIEEERAVQEAAEEQLRQQEQEAQAAEAPVAETSEAAQPSNDQTVESQAQSTNTQETVKETKKETKKETVESTDIVVKKETTSTETVKQESSSTSGQAVADYAVQFVGNPYVYGGTSLTDGADCSGFVQSVYAHFGYSLSRTAASQAGDGTPVSTDNLQPGDLLFYHGYGHVAIYIGGGQVVHASNPSSGIKISAYNYSSIDSAVRIIK